MKLPITIFICVFFFIACSMLNETQSRFEKYKIGQFEGYSDFFILSEKEMELTKQGQVFSSRSNSNRARFGLFEPTDSTPKVIKSINENVLPMPCNGKLIEDTLRITIAMGLFGGIGCQIDVVKDKFNSSFIEWSDHPAFKTSLNSPLVSSVLIPYSKQRLILDKQVSFEKGQQITGYLDFTSEKYYHKVTQVDIDSTSHRIVAQFTCTIE